MTSQKAISVDRFAGRDFAGRGFRDGVAKDQLIFIIICSAALLVAAVTMVRLFTGTSRKPTTAWQCLEHGHEFSKKTRELPPIECPKCAGDAVRVLYRDCPECGERVLYSRVRLSAQGQAHRDAMMKQAESTGQPVAARPMMMSMDMEIQYRIKQADGSYGWTDWLNTQQTIQLRTNMRCSECDALLFPPLPRSGRSGN